LGKYYSQLDKKPSFILALDKPEGFCLTGSTYTNEISAVLHPYYKLAYIKVSWGGPKEQATEITSRNLNAKDWHDEA
jgi:hypothetical protein